MSPLVLRDEEAQGLLRKTSPALTRSSSAALSSGWLGPSSPIFSEKRPSS